MKEWYIAKSEINRESWLISSLTSLGADVYYPYIDVNRRGRSVSEALLPTYVFCRIEIDGGVWWSSMHSPGLDCFLGENGRPTSLSEELIQQIRMLVEKRNSGIMMSELSDSEEGPTDHLISLEKIFKSGTNARRRCRAFFQAVGSMTPVDMELAYTGSPRGIG